MLNIPVSITLDSILKFTSSLCFYLFIFQNDLIIGFCLIAYLNSPNVVTDRNRYSYNPVILGYISDKLIDSMKH